MSKVIRTETHPGLPTYGLLPIPDRFGDMKISSTSIEFNNPDSVPVKALDNNALTIPLSED